MKLNFLFSLLSLLPVHPPVQQQNHVLVSETAHYSDKKVFDNVASQKIDTWIHFQSNKHNWQKDEVNVYLPEVFRENKHIPTTIYSSKYHYHLYSNHRFAKHLSYQDFCILEKQISDIVSTYMSDKKHHYGIILDEVFLQPEGITKYWISPKNYNIVLKQKYLEDYPDFVIIETIRQFRFI